MLDETSFKRKVCERLGIAISAQGLRQNKVAERCGVGENTLSNWLGGNHYPSHYFLYRFCELYPVTIGYLYSGSVKGIEDTLGDALLAAEAAFSVASKAQEPRPPGKRKA